MRCRRTGISRCRSSIRLLSSHSQVPSEDVVTPWTVVAKGPRGIDYTRVRSTFKAQSVGQDIIECLQQRAEGSLHHFFSRGIVFAHRDFDKALWAEGGAYLYTGRGPSSECMHLGHAVPFLLCRYLQRALSLPLVIQLTDDEKFLFRDVEFFGPTAEERIRSNIKDIIAFGFDPCRTFIFRNTQYMGALYPTVVALQRAMTHSAVKKTLGLDDSDNIGKYAFAAVQGAPCFSSSFPQVLPSSTPLQCIVPCAVDQDPFFVLTRHAAHRVPFSLSPPATLYTTLLPALKGPTHKMSSSDSGKGVISLQDSATVVSKKMGKAFSGGKSTLEEMRCGGVDLEVDVAYQMLRFFCADNTFLAEVGQKYESGELNSGDMKRISAEVLQRDLLCEWRRNREAVTDDHVKQFCSIRSIL